MEEQVITRLILDRGFLMDNIEKTNMTNAETSEKLMNHIQRGGDTHPVVDGQTSGFMSADMYKALGGFLGMRQWVQNVDINTLPAGLYEGANFTNGPLQQNVISEVDITYGRDGRKQFRYTNNGWATTWEKTVHTNGEFTLGWASISKEVILWEGDNKFDKEIVLKQAAHGGSASTVYYKSYKIVYQYYGNIKSDICYSNPFKNEVTFNAINIANNSSEALMAEIALTFSNDGKTAKVGAFREILLGKNGVTPGSTFPNTNNFSIKQIIGII